MQAPRGRHQLFKGLFARHVQTVDCFETPLNPRSTTRTCSVTVALGACRQWPCRLIHRIHRVTIALRMWCWRRIALVPSCSWHTLRGPGLVALLATTLVPVSGRAGETNDVAQITGESGATPAWPRWPLPGRGVPDEPPAPGWVGYRTIVAFNLGLGSAVGGLGGTVGLWPLPFLGTELGIGLGFTGTQYSLMEKLALGSSSSVARFLSGVGVSYADGSSWAPGGSVWLNVDVVGVEIRSSSHFDCFFVGGFTYGLAGNRLQTKPGGGGDCSDKPECALDSIVQGYFAPQTRMGLGWWF